MKQQNKKIQKNGAARRKKSTAKILVPAFMALILTISAFALKCRNDINDPNSKYFSYFKGVDCSYSQSEGGNENEWELLLVNKNHPISKDYKINLVTLNGGEQIDEKIFYPLKEMFENAEKQQVHLCINSAYRSFEQQEQVMQDYINDYVNQGMDKESAEQKAAEYVAEAGTSEHQTGFCLDLSADGDWDIKQQAYDWLYNNAYKFGFILRYPQNKENITGISYEPWHYRYVGSYAADIFDSGLCLEEYLNQLQQ